MSFVVVLVARGGQVAVVDPLLQLLLAAFLDQTEVVDSGRLDRRGRRLGAWVDVPFDHKRHGQSAVLAVDLNVDL